MSFKIKDSFQVGTVTVTNSSGIIQDAALPTKVAASTYTSVTVDVYGRVTGGTNPGTVETDTLQTVTGRGATTSVALSITNATASTTTATGCLILSGGLGVAGAVWAGSVQGTPIGSTTRSTGAFTTLDANGVVGLSPANAAVTISPTGTGTVAISPVGALTINPTAASTINNTSIGATTRSTGAFTTLDANSTVGLSPASANVTISPTGTGTVTISPAGALTINPTAASTINNTSVGATTRSTGAFTTLATNNSVTMTGGTTSTNSTTGQLVITGGVGVSENLNVGGALTVTGNLTVNGTTTTINSTAVTIDDPIFILGGDTAPGSDDNLDRGILYRWHNGSVAKLGFFGMDDSTGYFSYWQDVTDTAGVMSGTLGDMTATNFRGALIGNADTATKATELIGGNGTTLLGSIPYQSGTDNTTLLAPNVTTTKKFLRSTGDGTNGTAPAWDTIVAADLPIITPAKGGTGVANGANNTVTFTGNYTLGITLSGNTALTFPTSGTVLTAEADTLQTVTTRGAVTTTNLQVNGSAIVLAPATTAKIWTSAIAPATINVNTIVAIDTFATATYRSAKYTIQIVQGTKYQTSELRIIHDNTVVYLTEFAVVETNAGASIPCTYTAAIATGTLTVSATITDAGTTNANLIIERTLFSV